MMNRGMDTRAAKKAAVTEQLQRELYAIESKYGKRSKEYEVFFTRLQEHSGRGNGG